MKALIRTISVHPLPDHKIRLLVLDHLQSRAQIPDLLFDRCDMLVVADEEDAVDVEATQISELSTFSRTETRGNQKRDKRGRSGSRKHGGMQRTSALSANTSSSHC